MTPTKKYTQNGNPLEYVRTVEGWEGMLVNAKTWKLIRPPTRFLMTPERGRALANMQWDAYYKLPYVKRAYRKRKAKTTPEN